ncbi:hypothetical protein [Schnuerera ultunensis]|uniref:BioF2-like acetyltransferase domain-containing protein n=1 Tax=[Clostridium] ultunense Esp TaxID=1288971 RepID=A0A1M4PMG7_9FIRM|nr:hypothetical protein [Schnuerera ultunensis]SHD76651.1 conserved protein of unknown function [[Clostridium] ultunense Esp]
MKCFLYDFRYNNEVQFFLDSNAINQQNFFNRFIYEGIDNFNYYYVICKENEAIKGVMPFVLYINELGNIIHSMPFIGYGGIAATEDNKYEVFECIEKFLEQFSKENSVKLITICTPPFKNDYYELYKQVFKPDFQRKNFYQYLDLDEDVFKNMKSKPRGNLRRNLRKCKQYGVEIVENNSLEYLRYWYDNIYIKRLNETHSVIYPFSVFETFIKYYSEDRLKMIYAVLEDKIIGGGLYLNQGISIDNFMRVIDSEYFYTQAGTCLDYYSIKYAMELGIKYYNWQSSDEIGSSIYNYKESWGSKLGYHYYLTKIVGDIEKLKNTPLSIIKKEYHGVYVMPYEEFI